MANPPEWGIQVVDGDDGKRQLAVALPHGMTPRMKEFYEARGLKISPRLIWAFWPDVPKYTITQNAGRIALKFHVPCPHLTNEGKCDIHGTRKQPAVCRDYPTPNTDLSSVTPPCTVRIVERDDGADIR